MRPSTPHRALALLFALSGCGDETASAPVSTVSAPVAPDEELPAIDVREIGRAELEDLVHGQRAQTRVVNFWATWCGPCVAEMPDLVMFAATHPQIEVVMVSLDLPSVHESTVLPFVRRQRLVGVDVARLDAPDPSTVLSTVVPDWTYSLPYTLVVDASGKKLATYARAVTMGDLQAAIDAGSR